MFSNPNVDRSIVGLVFLHMCINELYCVDLLTTYSFRVEVWNQIVEFPLLSDAEIFVPCSSWIEVTNKQNDGHSLMEYFISIGKE